MKSTLIIVCNSSPEIQTMNSLVNSLETLYDSIVTIENHNCATRIRSFLVKLLHDDEFNIPVSDPNHPYARFAKYNDSDGNRLRLFQAMQELTNEDNSGLQPSLDMMFATYDTAQYNAVTTLLERYRTYAEAHVDSDSDSDNDSDSS